MNETMPMASSSRSSASYPSISAANQSQGENDSLEGPEDPLVNVEHSLVLNEPSLPAPERRFSLGRPAIPPAHYVLREQSDQLLRLLREEPRALIEVIGLPGVGKTTLLQRLIDPHHAPFTSYDLIAWIDCSSVSRAHADIQAISNTLGHRGLSPQGALGQVANYVQQHPRSLLILDGLTLGNVDFVLKDLKPSFGAAQLIYTTTQSLTDTLSQSLGRSVKSLCLDPFTSDQTRQLVQQCLPIVQLEAGDLTQVIVLTGGYPGVIQALCRCYQKVVVGPRNFSDFLKQTGKHQGARDILLSEIARESLASLEKGAKKNPIAARALDIVKQAAWLGDHHIPFTFFLNVHQQVDEDAINMLHEERLAILDVDNRETHREAQSLKLNSAFLNVMRKRYQSEQNQLLAKNIQRMFEVFSYLTDNESRNGQNKRPEDLKPYADLVQTLLDTCAEAPFAEHVPLLSQVLTLGCSLARLYYLHHGELRLAYECLQKTQCFFKQGLSENLIVHFAQTPEKFTPRPISEEETKLLKLYAQEYLYQLATIASQLIPRGQGQVAMEVSQNFEKSYAIQINLGKAGDPEAIAYTLRNLTRALRKQGRLVDALEEYAKLQEWMNLAQHSEVFDERTRAELLIDRGIIQKEAEDAKPEGQRYYQGAIDTLRETHRVYREHDTPNRGQALGMLSIYLGEVYLAAGEFDKGITHTCQILYYDGEPRERRARAYFNLARAFDKEGGYEALAKLFIDQAVPLQIEAYQTRTETLRLKIEQKLLQCYKQREPHRSNVQTGNWETQTQLTEYCREQLLAGSEPQNVLSHETIKELEDTAYKWLWHRDLETDIDVQQAEVEQRKIELEKKERIREKKRALQSQQDELWYRSFVIDIHLNEEKNRHTRYFSAQFRNELLNQIIKQLRVASGAKVPMGKIEVATRLIQVLSGALPKIQISSTTGITGTVDLAAIVRELTGVLSEWHHSHLKAVAQRVAELFTEPEPQKMQLSGRIQRQVEEMAYYAACCWQPVLSGKNWQEEDIRNLAKYGARRVMDYLKTDVADKLSPQERVVYALKNGKASTQLIQCQEGRGGWLPQDHWSIQGFFAQPGVKVGTEEEGQKVYLPSWQARPDVYGYRFGSRVEVRTSLYHGPFKNEAEVQQRAKEARRQQNPCTVM